MLYVYLKKSLGLTNPEVGAKQSTKSQQYYTINDFLMRWIQGFITYLVQIKAFLYDQYDRK